MEEEKEINEFILKLSNAGINIPQDLKISHGYTMIARIDIESEKYTDNNDGTYNKIFSARCNGEIDIADELGKIIKATAKGKMSQKLHGALWYESEERGKDQNEYYNALMYFIIKNIHSICELYEKSKTIPKTIVDEKTKTIEPGTNGQNFIGNLARDRKAKS